MKKLIWLTDLHLVEPGQDWPQGVNPLARLRVCLEEVRTLHSDAERIVVSGDLVQLRNPGAYSILRAELEQMPTPYRLLVGNHDDRDALLETSRKSSISTDSFRAPTTSMTRASCTSTRWLATVNITVSCAPPG